jgi:hypothetical protein
MAAPEEDLPVSAQRNMAGTLGLVFGLLSLAFMALIPPLGVLAGVIATCFALLGQARIRRGEASNRGQAMIGLVCGVIGLLVSGALVIDEAVYLANHPSLVRRISDCGAHARTAKARSLCIQSLTRAIEGR